MSLYIDRLADMEYRRNAEKASREFEACRNAERAARKERRQIITAAVLLILTAALYTGFQRWDSALNADTERVMSRVNTYYIDDTGHRIYYKAIDDGRVWLSDKEREGRLERPTLLGR